MGVLVTGAAGYIGSHTCLALLRNGYKIAGLDNYYNAKPESIRRVSNLAGLQDGDIHFYECDILDYDGLCKLFAAEEIDTVIHFAGLKAVGESCEKPIFYYHNNVGGTAVLLEAMRQNGVKRMVFSSSATVYGNGNPPYREDAPTGAVTNPYGRTKYMIEEMLKDVYASDPGWSIVLLRYFNPIGADPSGQIGEDPNGIPNNLLPYVAQVAVGKLPCVNVHGNDYQTPDGTGTRDYIHVSDLADGHLLAVDYARKNTGIEAVNLGTGRGYSVLEVVDAFREASGREIPISIGPRRSGDADTSLADPGKAEQLLGFRAKRGILEMCADSWRWQSQNPNGY